MRNLRREVVDALVGAFLGGTWHMRSLMARADTTLGTGGDWLRELAFAVVQRWREAPLHEADQLAAFISASPFFDDAWRAQRIPHVPPGFAPFHPEMGPMPWAVRPLDTVGAVSAWLELDDGALSWFADRKGLERGATAEPLRHYRRRWVERGERLPRLLEAPKPRLKALQRRILREVLEPIPVHDAAHGFVAGRSVLTHAALHAGQALVVRFDLEAFFTNVATWRALGVFRAAGYSPGVAAVLLGLCTTRTPESVLRDAPRPAALAPQRFFLQRRLADWHLPQGAPTSPALANLAAWQLDVRLEGWAKQRGLTYSRYADDLVFSGPAACSVGTLTQFVVRVAREEGFRINAGKTRVMRPPAAAGDGCGGEYQAQHPAPGLRRAQGAAASVPSAGSAQPGVRSAPRFPGHPAGADLLGWAALRGAGGEAPAGVRFSGLVRSADGAAATPPRRGATRPAWSSTRATGCCTAAR